MQPPAAKTQCDPASSLDGFVATSDHDVGLPPLRIAPPPLQRVSATPYGAAWVELRYGALKARA